MASHNHKQSLAHLEELLAEAQRLSTKVEKLILRTKDYDLKRQLKKIDAELMDVEHNLSLAIEMQQGE